jgi:hypothetical protein
MIRLDQKFAILPGGLRFPRLLEHVGAASQASFRERYGRSIEEALARRALTRNPVWTESLAVGSKAYVSTVGRKVRNRMHVNILDDNADPSLWIAREVPPPHAYV